MAGLAQQHQHADSGDQAKKQRSQPVDATECRHKASRPKELLDDKFAFHALILQALAIEREVAGLDRQEEDFGFAGVLELQFQQRNRLDLDTAGLDLAQEDRMGELGCLEGALLLAVRVDLEPVGDPGFQLVAFLRYRVVVFLGTEGECRQRLGTHGQVTCRMALIKADQAADEKNIEQKGLGNAHGADLFCCSRGAYPMGAGLSSLYYLGTQRLVLSAYFPASTGFLCWP